VGSCDWARDHSTYEPADVVSVPNSALRNGAQSGAVPAVPEPHRYDSTDQSTFLRIECRSSSERVLRVSARFSRFWSGLNVVFRTFIASAPVHASQVFQLLSSLTKNSCSGPML